MMREVCGANLVAAKAPQRDCRTLRGALMGFFERIVLVIGLIVGSLFLLGYFFAA